MYGRSLSYLYYGGRPYSSSMRRRDDRCDAACAVWRYHPDGESTEDTGTDTGRKYGASSSAGRAGVWVVYGWVGVWVCVAGCMGVWVWRCGCGLCMGGASAAPRRCAAAAEPSALRAPRRRLLLQRLRRRDAADRWMGHETCALRVRLQRRRCAMYEGIAYSRPHTFSVPAVAPRSRAVFSPSGATRRAPATTARGSWRARATRCASVGPTTPRAARRPAHAR